ncbi:pyridoxamine 5'-phosphate oxidase family protein [Enterococcus timonensis]|uniref:pyridoxamine 5'-phosphate oxidase family protein n=1 Tax=Enterococcus timonensis TaxID=1852364 RepID=UPI0008D8F0D2|nr:pyridoxamine 5'-phosphate oxidase family protein [Enterococcus timonensis]
MTYHQEVQDLIKMATTFLVSTVDERGFPTTIVVAPPIHQIGIQRLEFYVSGSSETVENILRNGLGSVCCYSLDKHESLLLKGTFGTKKFLPEDEPLLNDYQHFLQYEDAVLIRFETMICKSHNQGENVQFII